MSRPAAYAISDLKERPAFLGEVADRLWTAWWRKEGVSLPDLEALVAESLRPQALPVCLVAHRGDVFLGTVSLVADDLSARPAYTPWLAALWVEPGVRGMGVATSLVARATAEAFRLPIERLYLNATPENAPLYEKLGWDLVEADVGGVAVFGRFNGARHPT